MKLADKYTLERGDVYLTGIQALVRLPMDQMRRDRHAGLNTGGFISGYEGSPLGGYDLALARVGSLLAQHNIVFRPGFNEDLAATSIMGTQIFEVAGKAKVDGIVGIWYGKGPGVDRCGDVLRHANLAGTGKNCGALLIAGDDHGCKSSTVPHQSDFSMLNAGIPFLYPGSTQEVIDYGLLAIAMSRFTGSWSGLKMVTEICDGGGTVALDPDREIRIPPGYEKVVDARLIPPITLALEHEVSVRRLKAAIEFARLNHINRWRGARQAKFGIASAGKSYYDVAQALRDLGIGDDEIRIAKFGMTFPLDAEFAREFAEGLDTIFVVEEKRSFLELHLRDALYSSPTRPVILGKTDAAGAPLLPASGELDPDRIAVALARVLQKKSPRVGVIESAAARKHSPAPLRTANFCSGCPHNRSTILLPGQIGGGGIGCHTMAMGLTESRNFSFLTHMGGEGAPWIGMAPFTEHQHVFQNLGDGTYFHSGSLAVQALVASGLNITFKLLYNGHVSMTGGQLAQGALPIPVLTKKFEAEGVRKVIVLAESPEQYEDVELASIAEVRDRGELEPTLAELAKTPGVTVMIYDQECAAEKRRKRSRGKYAEPTTRLMIQEEVCEGCGDCVTQSNCMSLTPIATERGQKMRIHQSSCNKDYSCALGDCPSFVTVNLKPGTGLRKKPLPILPASDVPAPDHVAEIGDGYRIVMPGIGGTGVVTINALLATAAWIDGLYVQTLDQTGNAQKGGAVISNLLLARHAIEAPNRINIANVDLILGFDLLGAARPDTLKLASPDRTVAVINTSITPTAGLIRSRALVGPEKMLDEIGSQVRRSVAVDANRLAEGLFGTHLAVNLFVLGVAYQGGLIPLSLAAIEQAIRLNEVDVEKNLQVFEWGRKYYHDAKSVESVVAGPAPRAKETFDRVAELTAYQNAAYAKRYSEFVEEVARRAPALRETVERSLYKLMAYKDEYEVARLLTSGDFTRRVAETWESVESIGYNLHPPLLRRFGVTKKLKLGGWFRVPLKFLASLKFLRGGPLDVFGYSSHRREEHALADWYRALIGGVLDRLTEENLAAALEIAALPDQIRGYERIKEDSIARVKKLAEEKLADLRAIPASVG